MCTLISRIENNILLILIKRSGIQNEHKSAWPKNDLTTVFVAQTTDTRIKDGVMAD